MNAITVTSESMMLALLEISTGLSEGNVVTLRLTEPFSFLTFKAEKGSTKPKLQVKSFKALTPGEVFAIGDFLKTCGHQVVQTDTMLKVTAGTPASA